MPLPGKLIENIRALRFCDVADEEANYDCIVLEGRVQLRGVEHILIEKLDLR